MMNSQILVPPTDDSTTTDPDNALQHEPLVSGEQPVLHDHQPEVAVQEQQYVPAPVDLKWRNLDWPVLIWMGAMHLGVLAAPFFFSWQAALACAILHWATCSIGICLGYHRYLSHRSFKLARPVEFGVLAIGQISGEGTPLTWAAVHRLHHQRSDLKGDPHSPLEGKWWSHILWLFVKAPREQRQKLFQRYVPELVDRPMLQFFERTQVYWLFLMAGALMGLGYLIGGPFGAVSFFFWAVCVRMVIAYHSTWFVNSATHLWGYRNYDTRDASRNLWWVAMLAYGEGWHNNHHAHPNAANAGHRKWELDPTFWVIRLLQKCGLATNVKEHWPEPKKTSLPE